jgi:5'(3')-deoxyribonucleotidase
MKGQGLRHNQGKNRHDLIPAWALNEVAKVFTAGANKYADRNWEMGMPWSKCLASLKRHLNAFERGVDFDEETTQLHMSHIATNALFLLQYYKIYPQGDDRPHEWMSNYRIGLDIDEVLADWMSAYMEKMGIVERPDNWFFDREIGKRFEELQNDEKFWLNIPVLTLPKDIPFEPCCYITTRPKSTHDWTLEWLHKNGFSAAPVFTVQGSKVQAAIDNKLDWYVDDRYENFVELNKAGICTFLFDRPHNKRYNVGFKRIYTLNNLNHIN